MRKTILGLLCLAMLPALYAASYDELLARALSSDPAMSRLSMEEERAAIARDRSLIAQSATVFTAGSGDIMLSAAESGASFSISPSVQATFPGGASIGVGTTLLASPGAVDAEPSVSVGIPLVRAADTKRVAVAAARNALSAARAARERGALGLERRFDSALTAVFAADAQLRSAARSETEARRALERAVAVDGAQPGGGAYMALERKRRAADRAVRDAEAGRADAMAALRRIFSGSAPPDAEILPASWPEPDMAVRLPSEREMYAFAEARAAADLAALTAEENGRRDSVSATVGASAALTTAAASVGLGLSAGLEASLGRSGLGIAGGLSWNSSGPSASLSLSWAPSPRGDEALRARDDGLAVRLREQGLVETLTRAAAEREALESKRRDLVEAARDAEEDLSFAEAQLATSRLRSEAGLAAETELADAAAEVEECAARVRSAALDRIAWSVDVRLLTAGAGAFGDQ
jgi:hypothetical protein